MKFDLGYISFANGRVDLLLGSLHAVRSNAERVERGRIGVTECLERGSMGLMAESLEQVKNESLMPRISPPFREVQDFGLPPRYSGAEGVSATGNESSPPIPLTNNSGTAELFDLSSRRDFNYELKSATHFRKYSGDFLDHYTKNISNQ